MAILLSVLDAWPLFFSDSHGPITEVPGILPLARRSLLCMCFSAFIKPFSKTRSNMGFSPSPRFTLLREFAKS
jgi:hypothetical protein